MECGREGILWGIVADHILWKLHGKREFRDCSYIATIFCNNVTKCSWPVYILCLWSYDIIPVNRYHTHLKPTQCSHITLDSITHVMQSQWTRTVSELWVLQHKTTDQYNARWTVFLEPFISNTRLVIWLHYNWLDKTRTVRSYCRQL